MTKIKSVKITKSSKSNKKYKAVFYDKDNKKVKTSRFGQEGAEDFTIHKDEKRKQNYIKRHTAIKGTNFKDPTKPSTLSKDILWNKPTLKQSIKAYKNKFNLD